MLGSLNLTYVVSTEHTMNKICLLFSKVHIHQRVRQDPFLALCPEWWQLQECVSARPEESSLVQRRSSVYIWRMLMSKALDHGTTVLF